MLFLKYCIIILFFIFVIFLNCYSIDDNIKKVKPSLNNNEGFLYENFLLDSLIFYSWNSENWDILKCFEYKYNPNNNVESILEKVWDFSYQNKFITYFFYNENNKLIEELKKEWLIFSWRDYSKISYIYDLNNLVINEILYNNQTDNWIPSQEKDYSYSNGKKSSFILKNYKEDSWLNIDKETYSYTNFDSLNFIDKYSWTENGWIIRNRDIYFYDSLFKISEILNQFVESDLFFDERKSKLIYENGQLKEIIQQVFENEKWINRGKSIYYYSQESNLIEIVSQVWDSGLWINQSKVILNYNFEKNFYEQINQIWLSENWVYSTKFVNYFHLITDVENESDLFNHFVLFYPNPCSFFELMNIFIKIKEFSYLQIDLINLVGKQEITIFDGFKEYGNHIIQFYPDKNLPSGTYWIRIIINGSVKIIKPIVLLQ